MSLIKTVRNRTKSQYAANRIAGRFAPSQTTHAATVAGHNLVIIDGRTVPAAGVDYADIGSPVAVVNSGSAGIAAYSANGAGIAVQFAGTGGSTGGSGMEVHDLNGVWHTGTLADSQGPQFLKYDGSRQLTGNLSVASGITIDGIDLSAHALDANAHHNRQHSIISASDHTVTGTTLQIVGLTSTNTIGLLTPSSAPGAAAAVLASSSAGALTLQGITVTGAAAAYNFIDRTTAAGWALYANGSNAYLWNGTGNAWTFGGSGTLVTDGNATIKPTGDLILDPDSNAIKVSSGVAIQADNYASQLTGWRVTHSGQADLRYLYVDEMHAKSFIADLEQALAGGQIISKSVCELYANVTMPAPGASVVFAVRDLPSAPNMAVFQAGDIIRFRKFSRAAGSLTIADAWGVVNGYTDGTTGNGADGGQFWTFTRSAAPNAGNMGTGTVVNADAIILDYGTSGMGYHEINAIDGAYGANSPYSQIVTWTTHPATGQVVRVRTGNLYGVNGSANEFGLYAGDGTADSNQYLRISSASVKLNNIPLTLWSDGEKKVNIDAEGIDVWIGNGSSDKRLSWNGTTLSVTGTIVVTGGSGIGSFSDANLDNIANGSTYARVNTTIISGGNIRVGSGTKDSTLDGWHIDSGEIVGQLDGADQVVMDTTGKIKFGAGNGVLDASGVALYYDAATTPAVWSRITWYNTPATRTTEIGSIAFGDDAGVYAPEVAPADRGHALRIKSTNSITPSIYLQSTTSDYEVWHSGNLTPANYGAIGSANTWTAIQTFSAKIKVTDIYSNVDNTAVTFGGGSDYNKGARITMYGKDHAAPGYIDVNYGSAGAFRVFTYDWGSTYTSRLIIDSSGNVGINDSTPSYRLDVNGTLRATGAATLDSTLYLGGDLTSGAGIGGTWSTMDTLSGQTAISGRAAQSRRFGDITFLRGAIDPTADTNGIDLVQIATSTHRPTRTQYLQTTALGDGDEPGASRMTMHLKIHTDGIIECLSNTTAVQLISFDGLFFFNA